MRLRRFDRPKFDSSEGLFFGFEVDAYKDFIKFGEDNIDRETKSLKIQFEAFQKDVENKILKYDERYLEHIQDNYIDEFGKIDYDFRQNLRRSQIVMLYSSLESKLRDGCNSYAKAYNKEYTVSNLNGQNDLDNIKLFLKRSMNIKIDELNPEWKFVNDLRKVRNKMVHHNGLVNSDDSDFKSISEFSKNRFKIVMVIKPKTYLIELNNPEFLKEIIDNISKLYHKILDLEMEQIKAAKK